MYLHYCEITITPLVLVTPMCGFENNYIMAFSVVSHLFTYTCIL